MAGGCSGGGPLTPTPARGGGGASGVAPLPAPRPGWDGRGNAISAPDWFTKHVFNPFVAALTRLGLSVAGSRVLGVPARKRGEPRRTPVNLLSLDGQRYLVAPRGHTQWVRNLRVSGSGRLL